MVRHSVPHNSSSLRARSDRPTGHTTKTSKVATCLPLGPFTLAEKSPTMTRAFLIGRPKSLWIFMDTIQKKGKGQQDVVIGAMYPGACQHTALAMKWHSSPWLKKGWQPRRRNTRLPTAIMLEWKSLPWSGRIWRTRLTWTTRPQRTITTAASDHALRIDTQVGDRTKSWQQCCRCIIRFFRHHPETGVDISNISRETWTSFSSKKHGCLNLQLTFVQPFFLIVSCQGDFFGLI